MSLIPLVGAAGVTSSEHKRARWLFTGAALAACVAAGPPAAAAPDGAQVTVREDGSLYTVTALFSTPPPAQVAFAVLTDYEQIPRFMPDVRASRILERGTDRVVVEQEAVARFLLFSKRISLVLEVREDPQTIRFRDRGGTSFTRYEGAWTIIEKGNQVAITYELAAKPSFDVPGFVLKSLLRRDSIRMIEGLQREIAARQAKRP